MIIDAEPKSQEVRVMLQLTLDVDIHLSKEQIEHKLKIYINNIDHEINGIDHMMTDIIEIREEAEIYGNE